MVLDGSLVVGSQLEVPVCEDPEVEVDPDEESEPADVESAELAHAGGSVNVRAGPKKATCNVEKLCGSASFSCATKTTGAEEAFGVSIHTAVPRYSAMVSPWSVSELTSAPRSTNCPIAESAGFDRLATSSGSVVPVRHTP